MLVQPDNVRGDEPSKADDEGNDVVKKRDRYCKSCKTRYNKGAHIQEGKKRYAAQKQKLKEKAEKAIDGDSDNKNSTATRCSARLSSRNREGSEGKPKCYQCGKSHYPFCPRVPGVRGPCHVCHKTYLPYYPRTKKENRKAETEEDNDSLKLMITQGLAERLNELLMLTSVVTATTTKVRSNICRAVITVVMPNGKKGEAVVSPDSVSSVTIAKQE